MLPYAIKSFPTNKYQIFLHHAKGKFLFDKKHLIARDLIVLQYPPQGV